MIQIFYGMGKGKTSALNGMAMRAKGANLKVIIYRFLKGRETSEDFMLIAAGIIVKKIHHTTKFVIQMNNEEKIATKALVNEAFAHIEANHANYDVIIMDELLDLASPNVAMASEQEIISLVKKLNACEVIISGHVRLGKLFAIANLITEFKDEKHYFAKGVKARRGFEF